MTTTQTDEIKTWQQRLEETCPAIGPMHIHACVEEVNDAMQAEIDELRSALQEQAREGEAVANSAILARGRFHTFKGEDGEPDDWEWFEEGTNCEHGCIDAVIVRADAITAPQPVQPSEPAQPVAQPNIQNQIVKDISRHEPCHTCAHYQQGKLPGVRIHDETCYECRSYWGNKWEAA